MFTHKTWCRVLSKVEGDSQFGSSVPAAGDINNDGFDDVLVQGFYIL